MLAVGPGLKPAPTWTRSVRNLTRARCAQHRTASGRHSAFPCVPAGQLASAALSPPALWPLIVALAALPRIVIAAAPARIAKRETPAAPEAAGAKIARGPAHREAALRLVVQHDDELGVIIGLAV